ncbi:hypothetical protein GCM10023093_21950 [Nemorincola caseinilytica]|uniref:PKD domain-containing protein n=1 Tax=Nemorincola caseinilytica TaxID=2054315 RepID=A0ABP8NJZ7_9BACT
MTIGFVLALTNSAYAQIVGTNCFVQGTFLDIGMNRNASFGACNGNGAIPGSYHRHSTAGAPPTGTNLAETYDYGHDGWATGAPVFMGDYTYPGSPFEGWEIQIGTARSQAFQNCGGTFTNVGGATMTGNHTAYSSAGGVALGVWDGTFTSGGGNLAIRQTTSVDLGGSAVIVTTVLRNTGAAATGPVYYMRSCDPDNDQTWPGGGFWTTNQIVHQNEDARHRVLVSSRGATGTASYMSLGTKDCRARCGIYGGWPMPSGADLASVWAGTYGGGTYGPVGATSDGDIAIELTYNLGSIPAGDSTVLSYAYIFNGNLGIDSAFPDPQIVVNGVPKISWAPPTPNYDTFDFCQFPGLTSINVDLLNADTRSWSWSKWTWSPGTGLSATTGTHVTISAGGLPPMITYTITGTDSATGMYSCHNKVFYLTILTCNSATSNNPCLGDTIFLNAPGDSLGATYQWYGPAPFTTVFATTQSHTILGATPAHSGVYTVIKTVGGVPDTSTTTVQVYLPADPTVASNQPDCAPIVDPLTLSVSTDSVVNAWSWSGPGGFTSTLPNPAVSPFDSSLQGYYAVTVTTTHGCKSSDSVLVKPGPVADFDFVRHPGCPNDTVFVDNTSVHGATFEWSFGDGSKSFDKEPGMHVYNPNNGVHTVTLTATSSNGCKSTHTEVVDMTHTVTADFDFVDDTICNGTPLAITDLSSSTNSSAPAGLSSHMWTYEGGHTDNTNGSPATYTFASEGVYDVTLDVVDLIGCPASVTKTAYVLQPYIHSIKDSSFCLSMPMPLWLDIRSETVDPGYDYDYVWTPAIGLSSSTIKEPVFDAVGSFTYTITATMQHEGCVATHVMTLNSTLPKQILNVTDDTKIYYGQSVQLNAENTLFYQWAPNDGSLTNPNINNPVATPTVTTTYTVYGMDFYGCRDTAYVTVIVDSSQTEFIPSGFTPNGDGLNDVFRPVGSIYHTMVEMRVYNRWGQQVFYTNNKELSWDGTFEGKPCDIGTYHYSIIVARPGHDHNQVIKGEVTLIR